MEIYESLARLGQKFGTEVYDKGKERDGWMRQMSRFRPEA